MSPIKMRYKKYMGQFVLFNRFKGCFDEQRFLVTFEKYEKANQ